MSMAVQRGCSIFNCDRRHGNYCCADCGYRNKLCKNPCLNGPDRCGQVMVSPRKKQHHVTNGAKDALKNKTGGQ